MHGEGVLADRIPTRPEWSRLVNPYAVEQEREPCRTTSATVGALLLGAAGAVVLGSGAAWADEPGDDDLDLAPWSDVATPGNSGGDRDDDSRTDVDDEPSGGGARAHPDVEDLVSPADVTAVEVALAVDEPSTVLDRPSPAGDDADTGSTADTASSTALDEPADDLPDVAPVSPSRSATDPAQDVPGTDRAAAPPELHAASPAAGERHDRERVVATGSSAPVEPRPERTAVPVAAEQDGGQQRALPASVDADEDASSWALPVERPAGADARTGQRVEPVDQGSAELLATASVHRGAEPGGSTGLPDRSVGGSGATELPAGLRAEPVAHDVVAPGPTDERPADGHPVPRFTAAAGSAGGEPVATTAAAPQGDTPLWLQEPRTLGPLPDGRQGVVVDVQPLVGTGDPRDTTGSVTTTWDPRTGERYSFVQPTVSRSGRVFVPQMSDELLDYDPTGATPAVYRLGAQDTGRVNSRIPVARLEVPRPDPSGATPGTAPRTRPPAVLPAPDFRVADGTATGRLGSGGTGDGGTSAGLPATPSWPDDRIGVSPTGRGLDRNSGTTTSPTPGDGGIEVPPNRRGTHDGYDPYPTPAPGAQASPQGDPQTGPLADFLRVDPDFDPLDPVAWTPTPETGIYTGLGALSSSYVFGRVLQKEAAAAGQRLSFPAALARQAPGQFSSMFRDVGLLGVNNQTILEDPVADALAKGTIGSVFAVSTQELARRVLNPVANGVAADLQARRLDRYLNGPGGSPLPRGLNLTTKPNIRFDSPLPNRAFVGLNFGVPFARLGARSALEAAGRSDIPGLQGIDQNYWAKLGTDSAAISAGICVPVMLAIRKPLWDTCAMLGGQAAVAGLITDPPEGVELDPVTRAVRDTCFGGADLVQVLSSIVCQTGGKGQPPPSSPPGASPLTIASGPGSSPFPPGPSAVSGGSAVLRPDLLPPFGEPQLGQYPDVEPTVAPPLVAAPVDAWPITTAPITTAPTTAAPTAAWPGGDLVGALPASPALNPQPTQRPPTSTTQPTTAPTTRTAPSPAQPWQPAGQPVDRPAPSSTAAPEPSGGGWTSDVRRWVSDFVTGPVTMTRSADGSTITAAGGVPFTSSAYVGVYDAETGERLSTTRGNAPERVATWQYMDPKDGAVALALAAAPSVAPRLLQAAGAGGLGPQLAGAGGLGALVPALPGLAGTPDLPDLPDLPNLPDLPDLPDVSGVARSVQEGVGGLVDRVRGAWQPPAAEASGVSGTAAPVPLGPGGSASGVGQLRRGDGTPEGAAAANAYNRDVLGIRTNFVGNKQPEPVAAPVSGSGQEPTAPAPFVEQVREAAAPVVQQVQEAAAPVVRQVQEATAPVVRQVQEATAPVVQRAQEAVAPVVQQVQEAAAPVVQRVQEAAAPVVQQVQNAVGALQSGWQQLTGGGR
jgi:hypothetical protein